MDRTVHGPSTEGAERGNYHKGSDLRGMLGALKTIRQGLSPALAVKMGVVNKCFDIFEKEIVQDVVMTRIPDTWTPQDVFED